MSYSCDPMDCSLPDSSVHGTFQAWVGCHFILQGIFPTQASNLCLLPCMLILYQLSHQGSPKWKCLKINMTNYVQDLYTKTLLSEIKENVHEKLHCIHG